MRRAGHRRAARSGGLRSLPAETPPKQEQKELAAPARRIGAAGQYGVDDLARCRAVVRRPAGEQRIERRSQAVQVRAAVDQRVTRQLFGREIMQVPHDLAGTRNPLAAILHRLRQHQVAQLHRLGGGLEEDVRRRHVAVDDRLLVGVLQGAGDVDHGAVGVLPVQHARDADALDHLRHALAGDVLHRHPAVRPRLAGGVERHQVGVAQRQHGLDGDQLLKAARPLHARSPHARHAAPCHRHQELVAAEHLPGRDVIQHDETAKLITGTAFAIETIRIAW